MIVVAIDDSPQAEQAFRQVAATNDSSTTVYHLMHVRPDHTGRSITAFSDSKGLQALGVSDVSLLEC